MSFSEERRCRACGLLFEARQAGMWYCSDACRADARKAANKRAMQQLRDEARRQEERRLAVERSAARIASNARAAAEAGMSYGAWQAARLAGKHIQRRHGGRPRNPLPAGFDEWAAEVEAGKVTATEAARALGMAYNTFLRRLRERGVVPEAGKHMARGPKERLSEGFLEMAGQVAAGRLTCKEAAAILQIPASTFYSAMRRRGLRPGGRRGPRKKAG